MINDATRDIRTAVIWFAACSVLLGLAYPLAIAGVAQTAFSHRANGSIIERDGVAVGSSLVGQAFSSPAYFHGRPSAAGDGYDGAASSGSNLGPTSAVLRDRVRADAAAIRDANGLDPNAPLPVDAVTASGSGLDPHITPANAAMQAARVAEARGVREDDVRELIEAHRDSALLWVAGEPRMNVLLLNLALDERFGRTEVAP